MDKILIFGGGSKFGLQLSNEMKNLECDVEIITSTDVQDNSFKVHKVDWLTLDRSSTEKLCKEFTDVDTIIFNQNYSEINGLENVSSNKLEMMNNMKKWNQGIFINCELPLQVCNSLYLRKCFTNKPKVIWMLSDAINDSKFPNLEYKIQKYINHEMVDYINNLNIIKCIGFNPGTMDDENYYAKAHSLADVLTRDPLKDTYYSFDDDLMVIGKEKYFL